MTTWVCVAFAHFVARLVQPALGQTPVGISVPAQLSVRQILQISGQRNVVYAALAPKGQLVLARAQPAELTLFDSSGNRIWSRNTRMPVAGGMTICRDTIIALESGDTWHLVRSRLSSGKELARTELDIARGSDPFILGCSGGAAVIRILVRMRVGALGLAAVQFPERNVVLVFPDGELRPTSFLAIDSSIQITPPAYFGRMAMRPPFAPTPGLAFVPPGNLLYSSGTDAGVEIHDLRGKRIGSVKLTANQTQFDEGEINKQRTEWVERSAKRFPAAIRAETLFARVAALETTTRGLSLGRMLNSQTGDVLVRRRDMDRRPLLELDSTVYDVFDGRQNGRIRGRITLPAGHFPLAFDGSRIVTSFVRPTTLASEPSMQDVFVFLIVSNANSKESK